MSAARQAVTWAPDATLAGHADPCPACALRREALEPDPMAEAPARVECQLCDGSGRLPLATEEIIAREVAWARAHYWPEVLARWRRAAGGAA